MLSLIPLPTKILGSIFIVLGAAWFGYTKGSAHAEVEIANYRAKAEKQISDLKTQNATISNKVVTEYVDRTNTIREKEIIYREASGKIEPQYNLSNGWVHLHDVAAKLVNPDMQLASDMSPSGVMDNAALSVVVSNYAICKRNSEQLTSLQKWIVDNKAAIEKSNADKAKKVKNND
jgi:hypothetical protein